MMDSQEQNPRLQELRGRLKDVITGTCNTVGCKDCGLKYVDGCSATDLEAEIMELEIKEYNRG